MRAALAFVLPRPSLARPLFRVAAALRPLARLLPRRFAAALALAPARVPPLPASTPRRFLPRKARAKCASRCSMAAFRRSSTRRSMRRPIRLLTRHGVEVVVAKGAGCCGALPHHLGKADESLRFARANIEAWTREIESGGLDHIVINASGCGTSVKDYGHMFRNDPALAEKAAHISAMTKDVTELMTEIGFAPSGDAPKLRVAYHSACSLQHGQKISQEPVALLARAGFDVVAVPEGHICCGSAGTYNRAAAGAGRRAAVAKSRKYRERRAGYCRRRQSSAASCRSGRGRRPGRPHSGIARLGERRAGARALARREIGSAVF